MKRLMLASLSTLALVTAFSLPARSFETPTVQVAQSTINKQVDPQDEQDRLELLKELDAMFEQRRQALMNEMNAQLEQMHQEMVKIINERFQQADEQRLNR